MNFLPSELPEWATSEEAQIWVVGFTVSAMVRIFRACIKWFKRAGTERFD